MRDDPKAEGSRWLEQAREDLKWAEMLAREGGFHVACFLAQQVAEKALKAYLYGAGEAVVLGHSVERLSLAAAERDAAFRDRVPSWAVLDGYYVPTRYPNSLAGQHPGPRVQPGGRPGGRDPGPRCRRLRGRPHGWRRARTMRRIEGRRVIMADDAAAGRRFLDHDGVPLAAIPNLAFDQIVVTSFDRAGVLADGLRALGISDEKVFSIRR